MTYQILIVILPFITSPYLSRVIGAQGLGEYSYSYSVAYYFSLFILLGINNHGIREIARVRDDVNKRSEMFISLYIIQALMGVLVILVYILTQIAFVNDNLLAKIQLFYILSAFFDINWLFFGLEKFRVTVIRNFIVKILAVIAIFILVKDERDTPLYTGIMALGFLVSQLLLWPFALKEIKLVQVNKRKILSNIKPLLILFIPVVAVSIFKYMDKIMLGLMCSKSELGLYDNSEKMMSIPSGLITAIGTIMLPRIANMIEKKGEEVRVKEYFRFSLLGSMIAASALTFGLAAIAPTFAPWFWGDEFAECGILIKMISVSILFLAWANIIRTQFLIPNNMDMIFVKATIYGAIVNFAINFALIRRYGALGTVIGTVFAEFIVAFYQTVKCRKQLPIKLYVSDAVPYFIIGLVMYAIVELISKISLNGFILLIVEVSIGGAVFVGLCTMYLSLVKKVQLNKIAGGNSN